MPKELTVKGPTASGPPWWRRDFVGLLALVLVGLMGFIGREQPVVRLDTDDAMQTNRALRRELAELETRQLLLAARAEEQVRLQGLLQMARRLRHRDQPLEFCPATVIAWGLDAPSRLHLGRGLKSGIGPRDTVVAPGGVVGRVVKVRDVWCEADLLTHPSVSVSVRVQPEFASEEEGQVPRETRGIVSGGRADGLLTLGYMTPAPLVESDDLVTTSGLGGIFPEGLPVGRVIVGPGLRPGRPAEAVVRPSVEWMQLREVLVVHAPKEAG